MGAITSKGKDISFNSISRGRRRGWSEKGEGKMNSDVNYSGSVGPEEGT